MSERSEAVSQLSCFVRRELLDITSMLMVLESAASNDNYDLPGDDLGISIGAVKKVVSELSNRVDIFEPKAVTNEPDTSE